MARGHVSSARRPPPSKQRLRLAVLSTDYFVGGGHTAQSSTFVDKDLLNALNARVFVSGLLCLGAVDPTEVSGPASGPEHFLTGNW